MPRELNERQRAFARYYVGECAGNGTQAARKAGYGSPEVTACRLLKHAKVRAEIEKLRPDDGGITVELVFGKLLEFLDEPVDRKDKMTRATKMKALELASKCLGMQTKNLNVEGEVKAQVHLYLPDNGRGPRDE